MDRWVVQSVQQSVGKGGLFSSVILLVEWDGLGLVIFDRPIIFTFSFFFFRLLVFYHCLTGCQLDW